MNKKPFVGGILAAGSAKRMGDLSSLGPKAYLPLANKPLIVHQIEYLKSMGADEIYIVISPQGREMASALGDGSAWSVRLHYVYQMSPEGSAHALSLLSAHVQENILLILGDIAFQLVDEQAHREALYQANEQNVNALICKRESNFKRMSLNYAVYLDQGKVTRVIEKPKKQDDALKGCGIYLFTPKIFEAIAITARCAYKKEYELTHAIQSLIDQGASVVALEGVLWDINISTIEHLYFSNRFFLPKSEQSLIGERCRVHPGAQLTRSVVGANVVIDHPIHVEDAVIFPDTTVSGDQNIQKELVSLLGRHPIDATSDSDYAELFANR